MNSARSVGPADAYIRFYEALDLKTVDQASDVASADIHFRDPFNDVIGIEAYKTLLAKMLDSAPDAKFVVTHQSVDGDTCFIRWQLEATLRSGPWNVVGMTELRFAPDGKVREHIDHWDAAGQFYERLPFIGAMLRFVRRRVAKAHQ